MKKAHLLILVGLFLTSTVLGCNTLSGAGKDIESAGEGIQKAVD